MNIYLRIDTNLLFEDDTTMTEIMSFDGRQVKEYRQIKITSKRQVTIPKSIFELLELKDGDSLMAYAFEDGILLKPYKAAETVYNQDVKKIIHQAINEGYTGEELAEEIALRLKEYERFLTRRVQEFEDDIADDGMEDKAGDVVGVEGFNGLDIFFDSEAGTVSKES